MGEDSGWDVSDTTSLWLSLGSSWSWLKGSEHVFTTTVVIALHKGGISHTFRVSAQIIAKTHSPEKLSSICSQGLGLEHGRIAQRSSKLTKRNATCYAAVLCASYHPRYQRCRTHGTTSRSATHQSHESHSAHIPYPPARGTRSPFLPLPTPRSQNLRHGTSHRRSRFLPERKSVSRPVASIISPYDLRRGIDR